MKSIFCIPSKSGVYLIENIVTLKSYIGSAANMRLRCNAHKSLLDNGKHANIKLQRAYDKYGADNFLFRVLEFVPVDKIIYTEQLLVDKHKPFYNIRIVVNSSRGVKLSSATKRKMSLAHKGKRKSGAALLALTKIHKNRVGKPVAGKVKESLRLGPISLTGKHLSEETRKKISLLKKGKKFNKITRKYE